MKQFFKFMFASMLGSFLTAVVLFFITMGFINYAVSLTQQKAFDVPENAVLHLKLDKPIQDRTPKSPFANFDFQTFEPAKSLGLNDLLKNIEKAKNDDNIKGIYLDISVIPAGSSTIEEIRNALIDFKSSGKFIISYSEMFTQRSYYLASICDEIYLNPEGMITFQGLNAETMFIKGTLDKLGIEAQIFRGEGNKYKSAVEPLFMEEMSEASKEQLSAMINSFWNHVLTGISEQRNISMEELNEVADDIKLWNPANAKKYGFVDDLKYKDEILAILRNKLDVDEDKDIEAVSIAKYNNTPDPEKEFFRDKVAVVYASGSIMSGEGDDMTIGSERISRAIRKARRDSTIKAIVFRINSPGGSGLASDVIWREVKLAKAVKPVVVSMGDVAASGGYYIACPADTILASPLTVTGSIGVFGVIPNMKEFFNDKLGMTFDNVMTNDHSNFPPINRPMTAEEKSILNTYVNHFYDTFTQKVADSRDMKQDYVHEVGRGRVWSGIDALEIELIDKHGGLNDAIDIAVEMADLEGYRLTELPEQKDFFEEIMGSFGSASISKLIRGELGDHYKYYQYIKMLENMDPIQARLPYELEIH
ncbi:MAG: signal peptide peptidase SppA [Bacteroidales bacterium]|nr:signal peptide peptidase SppA [Bacteroidales bacterium]